MFVFIWFTSFVLQIVNCLILDDWRNNSLISLKTTCTIRTDFLREFDRIISSLPWDKNWLLYQRRHVWIWKVLERFESRARNYSVIFMKSWAWSNKPSYWYRCQRFLLIKKDLETIKLPNYQAIWIQLLPQSNLNYILTIHI